MGAGRYDTNVYASRTVAKAASGLSPMTYTDDVLSKMAPHERKVHERLDPTTVAGDASPFAGKVMRESRDSDEHPESVAIAVFFDVTGSMQSIPRVLQAKLPKLHGLLQRKGYVEHPQIMFGAIGDFFSDRAPLQCGQFESDNRMDEDLESLWLEGGGGGGNHESYQLAAYFLARHTATDCLEKRGKRGYAFLIGDERLYDKVRKDEVDRCIGGGLQEDVPTVDIFSELRERYDVYFLFAAQGSYQAEEVVGASAEDGALGWSSLLGQQAMILDDADAVCETIALTIGLAEGMIDLDEGLDHLREEDTDELTVASTSKALAAVAEGRGKAVATTGGDLDVSGESGIES